MAMFLKRFLINTYRKGKMAASKRPLLSNMLSFGGMYVSAEFSQQTIILHLDKSDKGYNWPAIGRYALIGTFIFSPFLYYWYRFLDGRLPAKTPLTVVSKVLLDQATSSTILLAIFYIAMSVMERKEDIFAEVKQKWLPSYKHTFLGLQPGNTDLLNHNRTDFYKIQHTGTEKMGFLPGVAEKFVMTAFTRYLALSKENEKAHKNAGGRELHNSTASDYTIPPAVEEVEIEETDDANNSHLDNSSTFQKENMGDSAKSISKKKVSNCSRPLSEMTQADFQNNAESYNGAIREHYSWSQTLKDLDVRVKVPDTIIGGKQVKVDFSYNSLKVSIQKDDAWETLVDGKLKYKINVEESMWTLVKCEHIFLNFEKIEGRWWDALLEGEPTIDIQKIDNSQPMEELDSEAQAKIGELFYNEQQKRLGKPTTEQQKIQNILKDAWDKEGSPFKGTPYDPSIINMSNSGQFNPEYQPPT